MARSSTNRASTYLDVPTDKSFWTVVSPDCYGFGGSIIQANPSTIQVQMTYAPNQIYCGLQYTLAWDVNNIGLHAASTAVGHFQVQHTQLYQELGIFITIGKDCVATGNRISTCVETVFGIPSDKKYLNLPEMSTQTVTGHSFLFTRVPVTDGVEKLANTSPIISTSTSVTATGMSVSPGSMISNTASVQQTPSPSSSSSSSFTASATTTSATTTATGAAVSKPMAIKGLAIAVLMVAGALLG